MGGGEERRTVRRRTTLELPPAPPRSPAGKDAGRQRASSVFPAPGGPHMKRWCPPAAATSRALRASSWPRTTARSGEAASRHLPSARRLSGALPMPRRPPRPATRQVWRRRPRPASPPPLTPVVATGTPSAGGDHRRRHAPSHRANRSIERKLTQRHNIGHGGRSATRCCDQPKRDGQVISRPCLGQIGRGEIDRDPAVRHAEPGRLQRRLHPVLRFAHCGVGEPDKPKRRNMTADVNLHPDWSRLDTDEGGRCDGGEHDGNVRPLCDILPREGRMLFRAAERG